jgi:hypothetical protein
MSKKLIVIIIVIIIVGFGYWICQSTITPEGLTEKEQACLNSGGQVSISLCCKATGDFPNLCLIGPCGCSTDNSHQVKICDCGPDKCFNGSGCVSLDEISILLKNLEQETGIDFLEIQDVEFKWVVKVDPEIAEEIVAGKGFEIERISSEQYDSIHPFFIDNGFETDVYNVAAGTVSGLTGYKKDKVVCTVAGGLTGYKEAEGQWIPPETDRWDITVECGETSATELSFSKEEALTIAQQSTDCSMVGVLTDEINYNAVTKTWWIDLERMPELENDGCNPACVVNEETKTAEVNWRCTGLIEP